MLMHNFLTQNNIAYMLVTWIIGGMIVGALVASYLDSVIEWGQNLIRGIRNAVSGTVRLIKIGTRIYKRLIVRLRSGSIETWRPNDDTGRVVDIEELSGDVVKALNRYGKADIRTVYA